MQKFFVDQRKKGFLQNSVFYADVIENISRASTCSFYMATFFAPIMFVLAVLFSGGMGYASVKCIENEKVIEKNENVSHKQDEKKQS